MIAYLNESHYSMSQKFPALLAYGLFISVLLIALGLRANQLNAYPPGISNDEAINAVDAFHFATTGRAHCGQ